MKLGKALFYGMLLFLILGIPAKVNSQSQSNLRFNNFTKQNGLSSNYINEILKDSLGFIWIATNDGLCRYDGPDNITVFKADTTSDKKKLVSSFIQTIYLDSQNNLWIGTRFGGLTRYHLTSNTWKTFLHDSNDEQSINHNEVLSIQEDGNNRLWVGTEIGLNIFDYETETFLRHTADGQSPDGLNGNAVLNIFKDDRGWLWVGTLNGMYLWLPNKDPKVLNFRYFNPTQTAEAHNIWKIYQDQMRNYWLASLNGGLVLMQLPENATIQTNKQSWVPQFRNYTVENGSGISSNLVYDVQVDQRNNLWVATMNGLNRISAIEFPVKKLAKNTTAPRLSFQKYFHNSSNQKSILGNTILAIFEDNQELLWFGTINGVSQYNVHANQFNNIRMVSSMGELNGAQNICLDAHDNLWMIGNTGAVFRCPKRDFSKIENVGKQYPNLFNNKQHSVIYSPDGKDLYIGSNTGITKVNSLTLKKQDYPAPNWLKENFPDLHIFKVFVDNSGLIWMGTVRGVFTIHPKTRQYHQYTHEPENPTSISDNAISDIFQDKEGTIWISTWNGLNRVIAIDGSTIQFEQFVNKNQNETVEIPINQIHTINQLGEYLYLGTPKGLISYHLKNKKFQTYSNPNNNASIFNIQKGLDNKLWMSCSEGIICFNPANASFNFFTKEDGAGVGQFAFAAGIQDRARNIYFGTNEGLTYFHPYAIKKNEQVPPVYITGINKISTENAESQVGIAKDKITLSHKDYYLSVNFAALNYNRPKKNQYAYRLEGFDDQWRSIKFGRPIVYTNLPPNTYELNVKAANNDGVWNELGTTLTIIKQPAYWETWWFLIGVILAGTAFILFLGRLYTNNIRRQNEALNKEISERKKVELELENYTTKLKEFNAELKRSNKDLEQFAYIASHDLKEPLRIIGNFSGLLAKTHGEELGKDSLIYIKFIEDGVKRMSNLINSLLTYSRVGRKELPFRSIDLNCLLKTKLFDLSELIKEQNTHIVVENLPTIIGEQEQLGMIFQNLLSNAIKFNKSENPQVVIKSNDFASDSHWLFSVEDNGIGINPKFHQKIFGVFRRLHGKQAYEGTGIGLAVCQKIVFRHQGEIWLESEEGKGTTFYFTISKNLKSSPQDSEKQKFLEHSVEV